MSLLPVKRYYRDQNKSRQQEHVGVFGLKNCELLRLLKRGRNFTERIHFSDGNSIYRVLIKVCTKFN